VPSLEVLAILALAVFVGALVQGAVGLGLGLVSAPVAALVAPDLMPGLVIWLATGYPLLGLAREWRQADWHGLSWALVGRLPATALGAWIVSVVSAAVLGVLVGVMVLVAVLATVRLVRVPVRRVTLAIAGAISGITGTATSIGGPPLAIVYQHEAADRIRATLAVYFIGGGALSLAALATFGELDAADAGVALTLVPFLVLGFATSRWARRHVPEQRIRTAVLALCATSAVVLITRSLV
jgi:uncharacterized protein